MIMFKKVSNFCIKAVENFCFDYDRHRPIEYMSLCPFIQIQKSIYLTCLVNPWRVVALTRLLDISVMVFATLRLQIWANIRFAPK